MEKEMLNAIIAVKKNDFHSSIYNIDKYGHIARDCPYKDEDEDYYREPKRYN